MSSRECYTQSVKADELVALLGGSQVHLQPALLLVSVVAYCAVLKDEIMEAYNLKYGTKVVVTDDNVTTPPSSIPINKGDEIMIFGLDGMYCKGIDKDGNRVYIAAWTEVEPCI